MVRARASFPVRGPTVLAAEGRDNGSADTPRHCEETADNGVEGCEEHGEVGSLSCPILRQLGGGNVLLFELGTCEDSFLVLVGKCNVWGGSVDLCRTQREKVGLSLVLHDACGSLLVGIPCEAGMAPAAEFGAGNFVV